MTKKKVGKPNSSLTPIKEIVTKTKLLCDSLEELDVEVRKQIQKTAQGRENIAATAILDLVETSCEKIVKELGAVHAKISALSRTLALVNEAAV